MDFWDHLEVMRNVLIRILLVVSGLAIAVFCFKDLIFEGVVFAPCEPDFVTYRLLCAMGKWTGWDGLCIDITPIQMININLSSQLLTHISVSFYAALIVALPYVITEIWYFVKPALYSREQRPARFAVVAFFFQFLLGLALAYFVIFPLTYNFLGTYQVNERVVNQISLNSYISTLMGLLLAMGIVFEMPVVSHFFAKIGVLHASFFKRYRKIAFVAALVLAAFITPSTDAFTMTLVAAPLYLLYEFSRLVVRRVERNIAKHAETENEQ